MNYFKRRQRQRLAIACLGMLLSFFASVSCLSIAPKQHWRATSLFSASSPEATNTNGTLTIHYSYSFQRHVVRNDNQVLESFEFLDQAKEAYPTANVVPLQEYALIAGGGLDETTAYVTEYGVNNVDDSLIQTLIESMPLEEHVAQLLKEVVPLERWAGFTPDRIRLHFQQLESLLESKLQLTSVAAVVVNNFPQVLLYDPLLVEERLEFLLSPLPPSFDEDCLDWPILASQGYGAGWSIEQIRQALQDVPHVVLAMHLEDAFAMKPSLFFFLSALQVSYQDVDRVRLELDEWGDIYTFAYLHGNVGLEWKQLSIMLQAFPCLSLCDTEPTWEMMSKHVRSVLKVDSLHYMQRRLQVGPSTIESMIKTHPRLSTYSVHGKIQPTLNALQSKLGLSSAELRKVILRMPSLIGTSVAESSERGLTQRLVFFCDEGWLRLIYVVLCESSFL